MKRVLYIIAFLFLIACQNTSEQDQTNTTQDIAVKSEIHTISLSQEKMEMADIKIGKLSMDVISDDVACNGTITAPPEKLVTISAPMGGFITYAKHLPGDYVKKGDLLIQLKHPDYIQLQQDYLDTRSKLAFARQDYERQKTLAAKEAASQKKLQEATAHFTSLQSKLQGLDAQLHFIGIKASNLLQNGIVSHISLHAPLSGYITEANVNLGRFVNSEEPLYEILDKSHLHLELNVYEKDVDKIQIGQQVQFSLNENPAQKYEGVVALIGQKMEPDTKTFVLHVDMVNPPDFLKLGMFAQAHIFMSADSVATLPMEAIITEGGKDYVFISDNGSFHKKEVHTGAQWENKVEIKNPQDLTDSRLVVAGAYYLKAEVENSL